MLVSILPVPFADTARQRQFEELAAALQADPGGRPTVLLGNLAALADVAADALLVRSTGAVLLVLTPAAGHLTMPALAYGSWQLNGQALPSQAGADNAFARYQQQRPAVQAWLATQLGLAVEDVVCHGLALFAGPLTFGPEVEPLLHRHTTTQPFDLLGGASGVPALLRRQLDTNPEIVAAEDLLDWADYLADEPAATQPPGTSSDLPAYLAHKLRQLWRWLGAEDIPADPPYGGFPAPDLAQRDQQEQARLHQLRQELQAELAQQRQEAAAREAARTQELAQLRQQLAQAGQPAATRQAEQQAQAALEAEVRTARTELAARHRELDARIQELGLLMQQLQAPAQAKASGAPAVAPSAGPQAAPRPVATRSQRPAGTPAKARAARPVLKLSSYRPLRRAERWGVLLLGLACASGGAWGLVHLVKQSASPAHPVARHRAAPTGPPAEGQRPAPVVVYDSALADHAGRYHTDEADTASAPATPAPDAIPESTSPSPPPHVDSARLQPAAPRPPRDSAAAEASPAP